MIIYNFSAIDQQGREHKGKLIAASDKEVVEYLTTLGMTILKIDVSKETFLHRIFQFRKRLSLKEKIFLARNISLILESGVGLVEGLRIFLRNMRNGHLKDFLFFLILNLQKGMPFYTTFQYFPSSFSPVDVELIKIGELSGNLAKTLDKWMEDMEKELAIRSEILSSLLYPSIILVAVLGVIILVTTFVIPKLAALVKEMNTQLPLVSRIILDAGLWIGENLKIFISGIIIFLLIVIILFTTSKGRSILFKIALRVPVLKRLILNLNLRSFCFVLGSLLSSGITLSDALKLTETVVTHPSLKEASNRIYKNIQAGERFEEFITREKVFPEVFSGIITIGSETGNLEKVLKIMEGYFEEEVRYSIKNLMTLLEPLLILFVGIIVGLVAISIVVPVYQQISSQLEEGLQTRQGP